MREGRFTDEQKYEIAMELLAGKVPHAELRRKWGISSTYACKLKDRALAVLKAGMGRPAGKPSTEVEGLKKKVADLEQLAGDQALVIRLLKKNGPAREIAGQARREVQMSVRWLARALEMPASTVGRWTGAQPRRKPRPPVPPHDEELASKVKALCLEPRDRTFPQADKGAPEARARPVCGPQEGVEDHAAAGAYPAEDKA